MTDHDTSRISPTAHYTGYVWCRHGLSPAELGTQTGRAMFYGLQGLVLAVSPTIGGMTLEKMLLQRHRIIDHRLETAIAEGKVGQIVEVAAGLSGRGYRLSRRYRDTGLIYLEGDLPGMVARKRARLARLSDCSPHHHVVELNALADDGPQSLAQLAADHLDPDRGTAIITEGLLSYFPEDAVKGMWQRFSRLLGDSPKGGTYLTDIHLDGELLTTLPVRIFRKGLGLFARGGIHLHYQNEALLEESMKQNGFGRVELLRPRELRASLGLPGGTGPDLIGVAQAWP